MDEKYIVAIDLGSYKVALLVAKVNGDDIQVVYYKETPSKGIRNSYVFNSKLVTEPLETLIRDAEQELNIKITQAVIGLPKYQVRQVSRPARMELTDEECISEEDVDALKNEALYNYPLTNPDKEVLFGAVAQSFSTGEDFQYVESQIVGMPSDELEGNFKIFIGKKSALKALDVAFNKLKIGVAKKYFTPDILAKAVLTPSEMESGVAMIDFGGGATSVTIYFGSIMRHYAAIPFGGISVTTDIMNESMISNSLAENIKLAFGACMPDKLQTLSEKVIQINSGNDTVPNKHLPVRYLSEIITCRVKEIVDAMLYEIEQSGMASNLRCGIVLTGGGANLTNCANYIKEVSGYNVRHGYPKFQLVSHSGYDSIRETGAAVCLGLLLAAKADRVPDCAMGETTVNIGDSVTFSGTGTEEAQERKVPEASGNAGAETPVIEPEIFPEGAIEEVPAGNVAGKPPVKKKRRVIWAKINEVCHTLFDEDNRV